MTNVYQLLRTVGARPLLLAAGLGAPLAGRAQAQYTPGNLVVVQVGDGAAANTTSGLTATTALLEYTPGGTLQSTLKLNATGSNKLTNTANGNSEGMLTLSTDGRYLVTTGYDAVVGTAAAAATATAVPRTVARIGGNQNIDISTVLTDAFSTNSVRGAASVDGSAFWVAGDGPLRYAPLGASTSSVLSSTVTNIRVVRMAQGNVYFSTGAGTRGIYVLGPSSNVAQNQVATLLISTGATSSPYGFVLLDRNAAIAGPDVAYIADDVSGIQKWAFDGSNWTNVGTIAQNVRGLTGTITPDGSVQLYATTRTPAGSNALVSLVDTNPSNAPLSSTTATTRATAPQNYAFRGVEFAPGTAVVLPVVLTSLGASRVVAGVRLRWTTASEQNSARFEVQRSADGHTFASVATVAAAGTSQLARTYGTLDDTAPPAALYYRLRQVDQDGTARYSATVAVPAGSETAFSAYPNPAREVLTIGAGAGAGQLAEVRDLHGRLLRAGPLPADGRFSLVGLAPGTYALLLGGRFRQLITKVE